MPPPEIGDTSDAGNIEAVSKIFSKKDGLVIPGASRQHTGADCLDFRPLVKQKDSRSHPSRDQARLVVCRPRGRDEVEEHKQKQSEEPQGH
jgi:hypothetical protein